MMGWIKQMRCNHDWKVVAEYREPYVFCGTWIGYRDLYCPKCGKECNGLDDSESERLLNISLENRKYQAEQCQAKRDKEIID